MGLGVLWLDTILAGGVFSWRDLVGGSWATTALRRDYRHLRRFWLFGQNDDIEGQNDDLSRLPKPTSQKGATGSVRRIG